ncbi:TPA: hypothetical protein QDA96_002034 [Burkholderia vietnamiensis]|uniref:hypothetical protein n=1 Tax=Burkholderia TaxID=32008 RepID=UPI000536C680|nr:MULTISPECIES: hypothetical protein [Burkholderia]KGW33774.1 hypothetical protein Y045_4627 [Burkholderia pseudomallei MSHR2451]KVS25675.1 hypothetical protein WK34_14730 [Burkholderia vietnamiensis]MBR8016507.1 hypothetical protein [Burkholderia vietnamiensis]CAG9190245.1 conserved hypothetical protein [Burkholderia vietnamiensis]CRY45844.1 Uncharacterised protein [Burkholderia pseudomallei]
MLYRGQDLDGHNKNNGVISPKGDVPAVVPLADGTWKFDGKFTFGETEDNAARAHHIETSKWGGCFISTTRDYETARFFATRDNTCAGVIYHIDESLFSQYQVVAKEFPDPLYPDEWEVSVRSADCGPLPSEIIVRIEEVFPISRV